MGSLFRSKTLIGYHYFMTVHMGLCRGPVDEIVEIRAGDKEIWPIPEGSPSSYTPPTPSITDDIVAQIDAKNVFGGDEKEGGIEGSLTVCMGKPDQTFPSWVKSLMGELAPDFRGVATAVFDGQIAYGSPYPKPWKFRIRRTTNDWDGPVWEPELATISLSDGKIKAMNPAHIIYECSTNRVWGRGLPRNRINEPAFLAAAETLFDENFGLCLSWNRRGDLDEFIQEVVDHIGATIYTDRQTGLLTLKLIRNDYVADELPLFDKNSGLISFEEAETASRSEAVNEVIVKYKDPIENETREVRVQNLASIQSLGGAIRSNTRTYEGAPVFELAARLAERDLRANTSAIRRFKLKLDRSAWKIHPGAVFRVSVPEAGINSMVLRAGKVRPGRATDGSISVEAIIDVFSVSSTSFVTPPDTVWTPPNNTPLPAEHRLIREATWRDLTVRFSPGDLAQVDTSESYVLTMAARPTPLSLFYRVYTRTDPEAFAERGSGDWSPSIRLSAAVGHYDDEIPFDSGSNVGLIQVGWLLQVGPEIMLVTDFETDGGGITGTIFVERGCVDTIPHQHAANTRAFFFSDNTGFDQREYAPTEIVDVKIVTNTSTADLPLADAPIDTIEIVGRSGRPYPPGNVLLDGSPAFDVEDIEGDFTLTWTHRDRLMQRENVISHGEASIGPEAGTTYNVRVYDASDVLLEEQTGISGASWSYSGDELLGELRLELEAVRGGLVSFQTYEFGFDRTIPPPPALESFSIVGGLGAATVDYEAADDPYQHHINVYFSPAGTPLNKALHQKFVIAAGAGATATGHVVGVATTNALPNGTMDGDTGWPVKGPSWAIVAGQMVRSTGGTTQAVGTSGSYPAGDWAWSVEIVESYGSNDLVSRLDQTGTGVLSAAFGGVGIHYGTITTIDTTTRFGFRSAAWYGALDNATLYQKVPGMVNAGLWDVRAFPANSQDQEALTGALVTNVRVR